MTVSLQDVERVAELANLELTGSEKTVMLRDLNSMLDYFAELNQLDTSSVEPMLQVAQPLATQGDDSGHTLPISHALRADEITPSLNRKSVLDSAPDTDGAFFKVPKVIER